jgi:NodT family efflux transporter outer membrane factor (OMF) lipoprotein
MKILPAISTVSLLAAAAWISGCTVGPDYHTPPTTLPGSYITQLPATRPAPPVDLTQWWKSLDDPALNALVDRAVVANADLQISLMRLQEARAQEAAITGGTLPALEFSGAVARGTGTDSTKGRISAPLNAGSNTTGLKEITEVAGVDAAWALDLFGGLRRAVEAAKYDTQAAAEARNDVLVTLIADVASEYMDVRALQLRLSIAQADVDAEQQSFDLVQARYTRGFTNELDLALAQRELATVQAQVAPLQAAIEQDRRHLAVLLDQYPQDVTIELPQSITLPQLPSRIEPGLPVELLRRRPDIRQSEREMAASTARIGVATDALYPHVALTGGVGVQGQGFGRQPLEAAFLGSIGPSAYWALLDFGTLDSLIERQDYHTRELLLNYQRTILNAVEEVDNAINNYTAQQDRLQNLGNALTAAQRAVQVASQRYDRGFTPFLDVLDAQRELYALQDQYAAAQEEVVLQYIALYKAIGGGWENYRAVPAIRQPQPAIIAIFHPTTQPVDAGN